jgi:hypothetical protein
MDGRAPCRPWPGSCALLRGARYRTCVRGARRSSTAPTSVDTTGVTFAAIGAGASALISLGVCAGIYALAAFGGGRVEKWERESITRRADTEPRYMPDGLSAAWKSHYQSMGYVERPPVQEQESFKREQREAQQRQQREADRLTAVAGYREQRAERRMNRKPLPPGLVQVLRIASWPIALAILILLIALANHWATSYGVG